MSGAAESLYLVLKIGGRQTDRETMGMKPQSIPTGNKAPIRPHLLPYPSQTVLATQVFKHEPMETFLIQTITVSVFEILGRV